MKNALFSALLANCLIAAAFPSSTLAADRPQWGEAWSRNMISQEKHLPDSFDPKTGRNIKWTAKLGSQAHSTSVVAGGRVYIGTNNEEPRDPRHKGDRGVFLCLDEKTGALLWQLVVPKRDEDAFMDWPRMGMSSEATVEGDKVYLVDNRGTVLCLDAKGMANGNDGPFRDEAAYMTSPTPDGKPRQQIGAETQPETLRPPADGKLVQPGPLDGDIIWKFDLVAEAGIWPHDAAHSSILIHGDHLYLNSGNGVDNTHKRIRAPNAPSLVVLDKKTGRWLARDDEHMAPNIFHNTWSSPSMGRVNGRETIFFCGGNGVVYGFEPLSSDQISAGVKKSAPRRQDASSPQPPPSQEGREKNPSSSVRSSSAEPRTLKKILAFDFDPTAPKTDVHRFNGNRQQGPSNLYGMPVFYRDRLFVAGGGDNWWGKNEAWLKCIDATRTGDITTNGLIWSIPLEKHVLATAAVYDGLVFVPDCGRTFHCVDANTGKRQWTHEIKGEAWASPCVADGKVYLGTRSGNYYVFAAAREKKVLAELELGEPISATTTAANGVLYVATMSRLYAIKTLE
jgi:outer membrane protein assembly factor BamB